MHYAVIVALTLLAVGVITVGVTIPLVFHFRNKDTQPSSSTGTTNVSIAGLSTTTSSSMLTTRANTTVPIMSTTTTTTTTTTMSSTAVPTVSTTTTLSGTSASTVSTTRMSSTTVSTISTTRMSSATTTPTINTGNTTITQAQYSSALTNNSQWMCLRSACSYKGYFQALEIYVSVDGNYSFQFNSSFATYAFLYSDSFEPNYWYVNYLLYDYTYSGSLVLSYSLKSTQKYIVVVTTYDLSITGSFVVNGRGPGTMNFTLFNTSNVASSVAAHSFYSSALINTGPTFCRLSSCSNGTGYYYDTISLSVSVSGLYYIACNGTFDSYGYLWTSSFATYLGYNDDDAGNYQFLLTYYLNSTITYWLIATTYSALTTGSFSIVTTGPAAVVYTHIS